MKAKRIDKEIENKTFKKMQELVEENKRLRKEIRQTKKQIVKLTDEILKTTK